MTIGSNIFGTILVFDQFNIKFEEVKFDKTEITQEEWDHLNMKIDFSNGSSGLCFVNNRWMIIVKKNRQRLIEIKKHEN